MTTDRPVSSLPPAELEGFAEAEVVEHPDLFTVTDFADLDQCRELIGAWRDLASLRQTYDRGGEWGHFDGRIVRTHRGPPWVTAVSLAVRMAAEIQVRMRPAGWVNPEPAQIVWWPAPHGQCWHHDEAPPDRRFTSILYLNDDYQGGATCFRDMHLKVTPRAGNLLCFRAGLWHGVEDVAVGERFTLATWHRLAEPAPA